VEQDNDDIKPFELLPAEQDRAIIGQIERGVDIAVRALGGDPKPFPVEKIYLVRPGTIGILTDKRLRGGLHSLLQQRIVVERSPSHVEFALALAHELLHAKSYKAAQVRQDVQPYRSGVSVFSRRDEAEYLANLEEAIVAEVTRQVYESHIRRSAPFDREVSATEVVKGWLDRSMSAQEVDPADRAIVLSEIYVVPDAEKIVEVLEGEVESPDPEMYRLGYVAGALRRLLDEDRVVMAERHAERQKLSVLVEELSSRSDQHMTKGQVLAEFAKANFTGNLLPVARLMERILGRGSFREMAERF
jgi:hypothetical protein